MQLCAIYLRKRSIYVVSDSFDEFGIGYDVGPMFKVETNAAHEVGQTVISALDSSRKDMLHPQRDDVKQLQQKLYKFLGVKSWAELARTTTYASVEREGLITRINPHRTGDGGGFEPDGTSISCSSTDADKIGRGVLKALKLT